MLWIRLFLPFAGAYFLSYHFRTANAVVGPVLAEEFGLVGCIGLLAAYFIILARCLYIVLQARDRYSRYLAGALTLTFFVYIFVNIGMVIGILPVVGVPLPLVSYGGTSTVTLLEPLKK